MRTEPLEKVFASGANEAAVSNGFLCWPAIRMRWDLHFVLVSSPTVDSKRVLTQGLGTLLETPSMYPQRDSSDAF